MDELLKLLAAGGDLSTIVIATVLLKHHTRLVVLETLNGVKKK